MGLSNVLSKGLVGFLKVLPHDYSVKISRKIRKEIEPYVKETSFFESSKGNVYVSGVRKSLGMKANIDQFEPETIRWIDRYVSANDTVWDIGANVGLYSSYLSKIDHINLVSFEPHSATHAELVSNIMANRAESANCATINAGVGSHSQLSQMQVDSLESGFTSSTVTAGKKVKEHPLCIVNGDEFSRTYKSVPNHIKIDVDGAEVEVLKGCSHVFKTVDTLLIEVEGDLINVFDDVMKKYILPSGLIECAIQEPKSPRMRFFSRNLSDIL